MIEATFDIQNGRNHLRISGHPHFVLADIALIVVAVYQYLEKTDKLTAVGYKMLFSDYFSQMHSALWDQRVDTEGADPT